MTLPVPARALSRVAAGTGCLCAARHEPKVLEPQAHHLWPVYLGGPAHPATLLLICPTTHTNVHRLLRAMVKADAVIPRAKGVPVYSWWTACSGYNAWVAAGRPTPHGEITPVAAERLLEAIDGAA